MKAITLLQRFRTLPEALFGRALRTRSGRVARDWDGPWCLHIFLLKESLLSSVNAEIRYSCALTGVNSYTPSWQWANTPVLSILGAISARFPAKVWTTSGSKEQYAIPCEPVVQEFHPKGGDTHRTKSRYPNPSKSCELRRSRVSQVRRAPGSYLRRGT